MRGDGLMFEVWYRHDVAGVWCRSCRKRWLFRFYPDEGWRGRLGVADGLRKRALAHDCDARRCNWSFDPFDFWIAEVTCSGATQNVRFACGCSMIVYPHLRRKRPMRFTCERHHDENGA